MEETLREVREGIVDRINSDEKLKIAEEIRGPRLNRKLKPLF